MFPEHMAPEAPRSRGSIFPELCIPGALCSRKSMRSIFPKLYVPGSLWAPFHKTFMFPEDCELHILKALCFRKSMSSIFPKLYVPGSLWPTYSESSMFPELSLEFRVKFWVRIRAGDRVWIHERQTDKQLSVRIFLCSLTLKEFRECTGRRKKTWAPPPPPPPPPLKFCQITKHSKNI